MTVVTSFTEGGYVFRTRLEIWDLTATTGRPLIAVILCFDSETHRVYCFGPALSSYDT